MASTAALAASFDPQETDDSNRESTEEEVDDDEDSSDLDDDEDAAEARAQRRAAHGQHTEIREQVSAVNKLRKCFTCASPLPS